MALRLLTRKPGRRLLSQHSSICPLHSHASSFRFKEVPEEQKHKSVDNVFTNVAPNYDLMSAGLHRFWKDRLVSTLNSFPGMLDTAIEMFIELSERGLPYDPRICRILFNAISGVSGAEGVLNLVYRLESMRSDIYTIICNEALRFLCKRDSSDAACEVYFLMKRKGLDTTSKSYYKLIMCLSIDSNSSLTWPLTSLYIKEYGIVNRMVGKMLLHLLCLKDVDKALTFLRSARLKDFDITFTSAILKMLVKDGKPVDAYELVMGAENNLPSLDVVDYSMVIDGLCKQGYLVQALDLCEVAENRGISFNIITYNSVINGLCQQGSFVEAFRLFDSLEGIGLVPSEITYATLIDSLCREGFLEDAKNLFDKMVLKISEPNIHVYNSMIHGYCKFGQVGEALKLLSGLEKKGGTPHGFSVSSVIYGYCLRGDMEGALSFFLEFKRKNVLPDLLGYLYLMKGFCTKGRMEEARNILREMLQSESVLELISKVDSEVESESIKSFLVELCEQGSINQAVTIIEEISSMFFSRRFSVHHGSQFLNKPYELESSSRTNQQYGARDTNEEEDIVVGKCDGTSEQSCSSDLDQFYPVISSLCSKGEVQEADRLVKAFFSNMLG